MTPEEIAEQAVFCQYQYYDGWFIHLDGERIGPYPNRDDAEKVAYSIKDALVFAIRDAYERAATIAEDIGDKEHEQSHDPQEDMSDRTGERIAAAIRALKGEG